DLDAALTRLAAEQPDKARLVQLRFFAELSTAKAAAALGVSIATAEPHCGQSPSARGRQLANGQSGQQVQRQKAVKVYRPRNMATGSPHRGQSLRHATQGRRWSDALVASPAVARPSFGGKMPSSGYTSGRASFCWRQRRRHIRPACRVWHGSLKQLQL